MPNTQPSHITPSTELIICSGIPFESNYEHVILFTDKDMQYDYFYGKRKVVLAPQGTPSAYYTYQRTNDGKIRIGCAIEQVINCNYLMFRNQAFENKWFYAFIQEINYVNNTVTEIVYEIDVMQTWMFDYTLQECYVEREHSVTDEVGDNTVPENLEVGEYVVTSIEKTFNNINDFVIDVVAPFKLNIDPVNPILPIDPAVGAPIGFYNNLFSGLHHNFIEIESSSLTEIDVEVLKKSMGNMSETHKKQIVAIYTIPRFMKLEKSDTPSGVNGYTKIIDKSYNWVYDYNGSTPVPVKNKKLYTYPFNKLYVTSSDGENNEYKYEMFSTDSCIFNYYGVLGLPPEMYCCPVGYCSTADIIETDPPTFLVEQEHINTLTLKNFPMSGWVTDGFKAWLTQTATTLIGGFAAMNLMPTAATAIGVTQAFDSLQAFANMSYAASMYGAISNLGTQSITQSQHANGHEINNILLALNDFGFHFYNAHIKPEYAAIIDDYFNKYGYATKRVKVPNLNSRPYWNYVETKNCNINQGISDVGGLNNLDTRKISDVYDHGVTFWHAKYHAAGSHVVDVNVGNYDLDNRPAYG